MVLLAAATTAYVVGVLWVCRAMRRLRAHHRPVVPPADQPPATAVGWPPDGLAFEAYVDEGMAALDAYLSQGYAA